MIIYDFDVALRNFLLILSFSDWRFCIRLLMKRGSSLGGELFRMFLSFFILSCLVIVGSVFFTLKAKKVHIPDQLSSKPFKVLIPTTIQSLNELAGAAQKKADIALLALLKESLLHQHCFDMVLRIDKIFDDFYSALNTVSLLSYVAPDAEVAAHAAQLVAQMVEFLNRTFKTPDIYHLLKSIRDNASSSDTMNESRKYVLDKLLQDLELAGCALDDNQLSLFKKLENLVELRSIDFERNIALDNSTILLSEEELRGVSMRLLAALPKTDEGLYIVGVDYPTYFEVMKNCAVAKTRERLFNLYSNRAYPVNEGVLKEIISTRQQLAAILGFDDYASLNLADKMAKSPVVVETFLKEISKNLHDYASKEFELLTRDLAAGVVLGDDGMIAPWDFDYQKGYYEKKFLTIDDNFIAEFFPLESTLTGLFAIYQHMLGLRFEIINRPDGAWHSDVKLLQVYNAETNKLLGYIFLDLFPRAGKYTHACCGSLVTGMKNKFVEKLPVIFVLANFPKPLKDVPSLLKHNDVITFFHEFGHAMHNLLGVTELAMSAGTSVLRDFVEAPSQMFEEWMWDPATLKKVSRHYKTGEPLRDELIASMLKNRDFTLATHINRQVRLSLYSLYCYSSKPYESLKDLEKKIVEEVPSLIRHSEASNFYASFGHLTGYGACYYGYLWSKVYAMDLWSEIKKKGVASLDSGKLIQSLLSAGGTMEPYLLLEKVLGRKPSTAAFDKYLSKG